MDTTGFKETKEMVHFIIELVQAIDKSIADGVSIGDAVNFVSPALDVTSALQGMSQIPTEILNLDEKKAKELYDSIIADYDNSDGKMEQTIKKAIEVSFKLLDLYIWTKKLTA